MLSRIIPVPQQQAEDIDHYWATWQYCQKWDRSQGQNSVLGLYTYMCMHEYQSPLPILNKINWLQKFSEPPNLSLKRKVDLWKRRLTKKFLQAQLCTFYHKNDNKEMTIPGTVISVSLSCQPNVTEAEFPDFSVYIDMTVGNQAKLKGKYICSLCMTTEIEHVPLLLNSLSFTANNPVLLWSANKGKECNHPDIT